jgi:predicted DNA-binding transcriptional regulator AlpA
MPTEPTAKNVMGVIPMSGLTPDIIPSSKHTIRRWVREGKFPKPFQLVEGGPDVWFVKDVLAWLEKRKRSRRAPPAHRGAVAQMNMREHR